MLHTNAKSDLTLEIDALSYGPCGIGRLDGKAIMIPRTVPGDRIAARITESKSNYAFGELLRVLNPSPLRQTPPCPYGNSCGGCSWQHLRYDAQLEYKQQSVADALKRIGKLDGFELRPIIPAAEEYRYRRRIRLQCAGKKDIGYFQAGSHHLVKIEDCLIADTSLSRVIAPLRRWVAAIEAAVEHVEIIAGDEPGEVVVVGKLLGDFISRDEPVCERLLDWDNGIAGLILQRPHWRRAWGQTEISICAEEGLRSRVQADVFTQVNRAGNRGLLAELLAAGDFRSDDRVLELYCGAGNFTLSIAKRAGMVVAVEAYPPALQSGSLNAQRNGLGNIHWIGAPVAAALEHLRRHHQRFNKIVLDPPRGGAKGLDADLASLEPAAILYVSCNPTTLARDLSALTKRGFQLLRVQPLDLFPHTYHVETLAVMTR